MANIEKKPWTEVYDGGGPEVEREGFHQLARAMLDIQEKNREFAGASQAMRTLHSKILVGVTNAELRMDLDLPHSFSVCHFTPGEVLGAAIRFSNASGVPKRDDAADMRGIAIKLALPHGQSHDLLMTNYPVSHARNANQFVQFATIAMGDSATFKERLVAHFGADDAMRMITAVMNGMRPSAGLQTEAFWSRGALLWGTFPVRLLLRPCIDSNVDQSEAVPATADGLREGFANVLNTRPVAFRLAIQSYLDEERTPIEDAAVEWLESVAPPVEVGTLVIPSQNILSEDGLRAMAHVNELAFNPWNAPPLFRPLGNINRARGEVYGASAKAWGASPHG
nr:catalase [Dyella sp. ASV24]